MSQFGLLRERRFGAFFGTQFLGAFNDNLYKNAVVILIAFSGTSSARADALVNLAAGIFILPFFLFSATAGLLADKLEKSRLIRAIKLAEVVIMVFAAAALLLESVPLLLTVLFLLGAQSTVFGPVKYSILPQHLRDHELLGGNGLVEMGTFIAILVGTMSGGLLVAIRPVGPMVVALAGIAVALLGWLASRAIPNAPAASPELTVRYEPFGQTWRLLGHARAEPVVWVAIVAISWFWFYGAIFLAQFPGYARGVLGAGEQVVTLMLTAFSVGVGVGSTLCERLSRGRVDLGVTLFGAIGLTLFAVDLFVASPLPLPEAATAELLGAAAFLARSGSLRIVVDLVLIGLFGGLFIVPLYALMQQRSSVHHRSRVIAANNVLNAAFMVVASLLAITLRAAGLTIPQLLLLTGALNALVAALLVWRMPAIGARFALWLGARLLLRLRPAGLARLPRAGAVLVVAAGATPSQALLFAAVCSRPPVLVVPPGWLGRVGVGWLLRAQGAVADSALAAGPAEDSGAEADPRGTTAHARSAVAAGLAEEQVVAYFPERAVRSLVAGPGESDANESTGRVPRRALAVQGFGDDSSRRRGWIAMVLSHVLRPVGFELADEGAPPQ